MSDKLEHDITKPIADPLLLLIEGNARLPSSSSDIQPLESLEEFDKTSTVDVRAKLSQRDRSKLEKEDRNNELARGMQKIREEGTNAAATQRRKEHQTILTRIANQWKSGPISVLHKALTEHRRVKVWVRNHTTVRSLLTGFVAAFDKHFNLALVDVDEASIVAKAAVKCAILAPYEHLQPEIVHDEAELLQRLNIDSSETIGDESLPLTKAPETDACDEGTTRLEAVKNVGEEKTTKKKLAQKIHNKKQNLQQNQLKAEATQRFIPQLFVRGEHVVMIGFAD